MAEQTCPNCGKAYKIGDEVCRYCGLVFPFSTVVIPPRRLLQGRYEIRELIHTGGMGYIYLAKDKKLYDRDIIVKQVREPIKDENHRKKLEEEASSMAKLENPNIALILDHFVEDGYYFIAVERIVGKTLGEVFKERGGKFSESEVLDWAVTICEVVGYLHSKNVLHRDISPDNIMLTGKNILKFIDFGTSHEFRYYGTAGTVGIGKYGYTPPEQWRGKPEQRSDIFAIGATIYYLLTGYLPLSQEYLTGQAPQIGDYSPEYPPIRTKNPEVSAGLEEVLQKALQLDIDKRYGSAAEFEKALRGLEKGKKKKPDVRREMKVRLPKPGPVLKKRAVLFGITGIIILALGGLVIPWSLGVFSSGESSTTPSATTPAYTTTPPTGGTTTSPPITTTPTATTPTDNRLPNLGDLAKPEGGKEGGRLQLTSNADVTNIGDPNQSMSPADVGYSFLVVEPLLIIGTDGALKPWLAESYEIAEDGSSITLYLRQGITFTDGTPFNADAAKYNIDNGINNTMWPNMSKVEKCVRVDKYTVRVDFKNSTWDWSGAKSLASFYSVMMYSPTILENGTSEYKKTHVVGTGPFILKEFYPNQKLVYDRNENYWRGKPYLDGIDINIVPDSLVALLAFKSGQIHALNVQANDALDLIEEGFKIVESTDTVLNMCLIPSSGNPDSILSNINIRRAVESAIDKQALVDAFTYGSGVPTNQVFYFEPFMNPSTVGYPYDLNVAKHYLELSGYPEGFTTTIYIVQGMSDDIPMAIKGMLEEVGIIANVETLDYIQLVEMVSGGGTGWDGYMYSFSFSGTTVDPTSTLINGPLSAVHSPDDPEEWVRTTWISCEQPEGLCDLAEMASLIIYNDARIPVYQEISKKMTDDYCMWTFLYYTPNLISLSPLVKGHSIGEYREFYVYTFAWLDE